MHVSQIEAARVREIKKRDTKFWKILDMEERLDYQAIRDRLARRSREDDYYKDIGISPTQEHPQQQRLTHQLDHSQQDNI